MNCAAGSAGVKRCQQSCISTTARSSRADHYCGHREVHVHPNGKRRLSVYEAMLLQGFPKRNVLKGTLSDQIRQVSDAVPPPLARALARRIRLHLQPRATKNGQRTVRAELLSTASQRDGSRRRDRRAKAPNVRG